MRTSSLILALLLCWVGTPDTARADEIVLKNGNRFKGRVLKETSDKVTFQCDVGVITLRRSKIRSIKKGAWSPEPKLDSSKARPTRKAASRRGKARRPRKASPG